MKRLVEIRAPGMVLLTVVLLAACSQSSPSQTSNPPTSVEAAPTAPASNDPRLNPTAAVGGGINASNAISADDISNIFKSVSQFSQLKIAANSSPPGAKGSDVQSVSVNCQDIGGALTTLQPARKRTLRAALL